MLTNANTQLPVVERELDEAIAIIPPDKQALAQLAIVAEFARLIAVADSQMPLAELALQLDEFMVRLGPKTCFQEQMLAAFIDAAGLRLQAMKPGD